MPASFCFHRQRNAASQKVSTKHDLNSRINKTTLNDKFPLLTPLQATSFDHTVYSPEGILIVVKRCSVVLEVKLFSCEPVMTIILEVLYGGEVVTLETSNTTLPLDEISLFE